MVCARTFVGPPQDSLRIADWKTATENPNNNQHSTRFRSDTLNNLCTYASKPKKKRLKKARTHTECFRCETPNAQIIEFSIFYFTFYNMVFFSFLWKLQRFMITTKCVLKLAFLFEFKSNNSMKMHENVCFLRFVAVYGDWPFARFLLYRWPSPCGTCSTVDYIAVEQSYRMIAPLIKTSNFDINTLAQHHTVNWLNHCADWRFDIV